MGERTLAEVISERQVETVIQATDDQVLAIDVFQDWAAIFRFSLSPSGDFSTENEIGRRQANGTWLDISSGGMYGSGWPWTRSPSDWADEPLLSFGHNGMDVDLDDGTTAAVLATCGIADRDVDAIRVAGASYERTISPTTTGAYVAVAVGRGSGFVTLTALRSGVPLGPAHSLPSPNPVS